MGNRIIFIAEMRNPKTDASSTQIMTRNLLHGFCRLAEEVIFVPVIARRSDEADIRSAYAALCTRLIFARETSRFKTHVLLRQVSWLHNAVCAPARCVPEALLEALQGDLAHTTLVSQSPSVDTAVICKRIKKQFPELRYVQYWGDPLALSLITPEQYSPRRALLKQIERTLHGCADRVVYGTQSLYRAQTALFPELREKAAPCRVGYMPEASSAPRRGGGMRFGYFGNYYASIRDLVPLYEAFREIDDAQLILCGATDLSLQATDRIEIRERVAQAEAARLEAELDVEICVLNKVGIQIPGKTFYHTHTDRQILVVLDGPRKAEIRSELAQSGRFLFCENDRDSILRALRDIRAGACRAAGYDPQYYAPETACRQLLAWTRTDAQDDSTEGPWQTDEV